jgi:NAD+ synthase
MKIFLGQVVTKVGDLSHNFDVIMESYHRSRCLDCDVCILPELVTTGYIPKDLLLNSEFIKQLHGVVERIISHSNGCDTTLLLSTPMIGKHGNLHNTVLVIQDGKVISQTGKHHLANYGLFDEKRYFSPVSPQIIEIKGIRIGVPVCEDIWFDDVIAQLKNSGAEMLIVPNASPFEQNKFARRLQIVKQRFNESGLPIVYCNQVLAHDGVVFDGMSFCYDGSVTCQLKAFSSDEAVINYQEGKLELLQGYNRIQAVPQDDLIYSAMVYATRRYFSDNGFSQAIIGLSGGIDSALVAAIAGDALGEENVQTYMLKSQFTSTESLEDAAHTAMLLRMQHRVLDITESVQVLREEIGELSPLSQENLQARIRGIMLMSIANNTNSLLLTTGNKSEIATGYCTLYGDMCGAFNPIKDIYKTQVFAMMHFRNANIPQSIEVRNKTRPVVASNILCKEPSAELRSNQKDSDSLPPYGLLDEILYLHIEQDLAVPEIIAQGYDAEIVARVARLVKLAEYKRQQSAPGAKISKKSFGLERRYPITL